MKISGIYKIQSISHPERCYIGSGISLRERKNSHFSKLRKSKHENGKLQNHYNKYGESDLIFIIIEPCFPEFLLIREQYYIDTLNPYFNICKIAGNTTGCKHSPESIKKMRIIHTGVKHSEKTKRKMSKNMKGNKNGLGNKNAVGGKGFLGHHHTLESKIKLSRPKSEEHKKKISESSKGRNIGNSYWKLRPLDSEETRKKKSESHKGKIPWNKGLKLHKSA